jgi:hypothetical protein
MESARAKYEPYILCRCYGENEVLRTPTKAKRTPLDLDLEFLDFEIYITLLLSVRLLESIDLGEPFVSSVACGDYSIFLRVEALKLIQQGRILMHVASQLGLIVLDGFIVDILVQNLRLAKGLPVCGNAICTVPEQQPIQNLSAASFQ